MKINNSNLNHLSLYKLSLGSELRLLNQVLKYGNDLFKSCVGVSNERLQCSIAKAKAKAKPKSEVELTEFRARQYTLALIKKVMIGSFDIADKKPEFIEALDGLYEDLEKGATQNWSICFIGLIRDLKQAGVICDKQEHGIYSFLQEVVDESVCASA